MWVTQEGEGQQTLRVCHMSDSPSLLSTGSLVISAVVTFTHQALAASGSGAGLGLSPSEKGYGLAFSSIVLRMSCRSLLGVATLVFLAAQFSLSCSASSVASVLAFGCFYPCLTLGHNQPFLLSPWPVFGALLRDILGSPLFSGPHSSLGEQTGRLLMPYGALRCLERILETTE